MTKTGRLGLPYIIQGQAQKEVTHNQALNKLDVFVNTVVEDIVDNVPGNPKDGDIYIIGLSPTEVFSGHANKLAQYTSGSWTFYTPIQWMEVMLKSQQHRLIYDGNTWVTAGLISKDTGEYLRIEHWQEDVLLSGDAVNTVNALPDHSLVIAVNIRVLVEITAATGFDIGVENDLARYGLMIGTAQDITNIGMTNHPITYYYDTPITLTAHGNSFAGGIVRVTSQYLKPRGPWTW